MPGPTSDIFPAITGSGSWVGRPTTRSGVTAHKVLCARARATLREMQQLGTTARAKPPKTPGRAAQRTMLFACLDILALILALWRWS